MNKYVGVYVNSQTLCLDCATEEEKDKATEDQSIHDYWITDDECFGHFTLCCERCDKELADWQEYHQEEEERIEKEKAGDLPHQDED